jgi:serine phosphatase RsbU (regulator of sigma subunit)
LLADFATRLTTSLDADAITHLLANMLVPQLASWCLVHLKDSDGRAHTFIEHERLGFDRQVKELVDRLNQAIAEGMPTENPSRRVLRGELSNVLVSNVDADPSAAGLRHDDISEIARQLGIASVIIVPLAVRDRILGCVTIIADATRPRFDQADLSLGQELATRAALMLENSRLYAHERTAAVSLQRSLLPLVPQVPGFTVAAEYLTATDQAAVGGDWYDIFAVQDGSIGVAVGDAMGHNFDSAAAMGKLSTMLRAYAWPGARPGEALDSVDQLITGTGANYLATCFYGVLRPTAHGAEFDYASAGHPAPILRRPDGNTQILDRARGAMLGVLPLLKDRARPRDTTLLSLERGSTLIVFTDGLTDSMGDELDVNSAVERLAVMIRELPVNASPQTVVSALAERADRGGRKDDVAVIAVRVD